MIVNISEKKIQKLYEKWKEMKNNLPPFIQLEHSTNTFLLFLYFISFS